LRMCDNAEKLSFRRSEAVHREIGDPLDADKSGIQKDHIISENLDPQLSLGMSAPGSRRDL
jgi:hypothetical protein